MIENLKKDDLIMILPEDKGRVSGNSFVSTSRKNRTSCEKDFAKEVCKLKIAPEEEMRSPPC